METINYVILTTGRSGSTLFCKLLTLNGIFKSDDDFNCETFHKEKDRIKIKDETPKEFLKRILDQYQIIYGNVNIKGIKVISSQFNNLAKRISKDHRYGQFRYEDIAKNLPLNTKFIIINRRNVKKQAISYLKAIKGFGWEYESSNFRRIIISHPVEIDSIIGQINNEQKLVRSFIRENRIKPLIITYEDLCADSEATIKKVFQFFNLSIPDKLNLDTGYKRQYDKLNDELLEEYELYRRIKRIRKKGLMLCPFIMNAF